MSSERTARAWLITLALVCGLAACDSNSSELPAIEREARPAGPAATVQRPAPAPEARAVTSASSSAQWETRAPQLSDADIPPLPVVPYPAARPMDVVRAVYVFAARHPEVLSHVPCFCGCESRGHKHNDDCFVSQRDAKGRPTKWEAHGVG